MTHHITLARILQYVRDNHPSAAQLTEKLESWDVQLDGVRMHPDFIEVFGMNVSGTPIDISFSLK